MLSLRKSILISASFHVGIFSVFFFLSSPGGAKVIYKPQYQVRLVQPSEIAGLQQKAGKSAPKADPVPAAKNTGKKEVVLPDKKEIKPQPKKETKPEPKKETRSADKVSEGALDNVLARLGDKARAADPTGPSPQAGMASAGRQEQQWDLPYREYYDLVEQRVRENWTPPKSPDSTERDVMTVVSITLLPDGRVLKSFIEESSGDPMFDESVIRAIMKATPLPAPPVGLEQRSFDLGLRFHSSPYMR